MRATKGSSPREERDESRNEVSFGGRRDERKGAPGYPDRGNVDQGWGEGDGRRTEDWAEYLALSRYIDEALVGDA